MKDLKNKNILFYVSSNKGEIIETRSFNEALLHAADASLENVNSFIEVFAENKAGYKWWSKRWGGEILYHYDDFGEDRPISIIKITSSDIRRIPAAGA